MGIIGRCMFVLGICSCRHFEVDRIMGWLSVCERRVNSEFDVTRAASALCFVIQSIDGTYVVECSARFFECWYVAKSHTFMLWWTSHTVQQQQQQSQNNKAVATAWHYIHRARINPCIPHTNAHTHMGMGNERMCNKCITGRQAGRQIRSAQLSSDADWC